MLRERIVEVRQVPRFMANLDREREFAERAHDIAEPRAVLLRALEGPRKLHQHGAELACRVQRLERYAHVALIGARPRAVALMGEALPQLDREAKIRRMRGL